MKKLLKENKGKIKSIFLLNLFYLILSGISIMSRLRGSQSQIESLSTDNLKQLFKINLVLETFFMGAVIILGLCLILYIFMKLKGGLKDKTLNDRYFKFLGYIIINFIVVVLLILSIEDMLIPSGSIAGKMIIGLVTLFVALVVTDKIIKKLITPREKRNKRKHKKL